MSVSPESIQVGRCYLSQEGRVRRVLHIQRCGNVRYSYRGNHVRGATKWRSGRLQVGAFAATVEREVPCDWLPAVGR